MRDDLGDEHRIDRAPRTIVSLVPSLTELVIEWGLAERLVGVTDYCPPLGGTEDRAARIRGTKNPDTERIALLGPDLVLADQEENRRIDVERLRAAGLTVWVTSVRSVRDVATSMLRLGDVLERPTQAAALAADIEAELAAATSGSEASASGGSSVCMIWRDGPDRGADETWWTVGPETYAGDLLASAGLPPVDVGGDGRYPRATLADVRARDPGLVLLPDEPYEFSDEDVEAFAGWPAEVVLCSGQPLFWWGPRTPGALRWLRSERAPSRRRPEG